MAPWLLQALRLMAGGLGAGVAFETGQQAIEGFADRGGVLEGGRVFPAGFAPKFLTASGEVIKKRRRRRRALTASDKADIAFIVGLLGPAAGKQFSTTLAARPR